MLFFAIINTILPIRKAQFQIKADIWFIIILYSLLLVFGVISNLIVIVTLLITLKKSILSKPSALYVMHMARILFSTLGKICSRNKSSLFWIGYVNLEYVKFQT